MSAEWDTLHLGKSPIEYTAQQHQQSSVVLFITYVRVRQETEPQDRKHKKANDKTGGGNINRQHKVIFGNLLQLVQKNITSIT